MSWTVHWVALFVDNEVLIKKLNNAGFGPKALKKF